MKKRTSRLLATLLTLCMVLMLLPTVALAAGESATISDLTISGAKEQAITTATAIICR
ncbi:MAG: hypothetical protein PHE09_09760 [Oscillospiraceae bacterium]|nr:hypothetical protein [Oscillospiraceae bacterium]